MDLIPIIQKPIPVKLPKIKNLLRTLKAFKSIKILKALKAPHVRNLLPAFKAVSNREYNNTNETRDKTKHLEDTNEEGSQTKQKTDIKEESKEILEKEIEIIMEIRKNKLTTCAMCDFQSIDEINVKIHCMIEHDHYL